MFNVEPLDTLQKKRKIIKSPKRLKKQKPQRFLSSKRIPKLNESRMSSIEDSQCVNSMCFSDKSSIISEKNNYFLPQQIQNKDASYPENMYTSQPSSRMKKVKQISVTSIEDNNFRNFSIQRKATKNGNKNKNNSLGSSCVFFNFLDLKYTSKNTKGQNNFSSQLAINMNKIKNFFTSNSSSPKHEKNQIQNSNKKFLFNEQKPRNNFGLQGHSKGMINKNKFRSQMTKPRFQIPKKPEKLFNYRSNNENNYRSANKLVKAELQTNVSSTKNINSKSGINRGNTVSTSKVQYNNDCCSNMFFNELFGNENKNVQEIRPKKIGAKKMNHKNLNNKKFKYISKKQKKPNFYNFDQCKNSGLDINKNYQRAINKNKKPVKLNYFTDSLYSDNGNNINQYDPVPNQKPKMHSYNYLIREKKNVNFRPKMNNVNLIKNHFQKRGSDETKNNNKLMDFKRVFSTGMTQSKPMYKTAFLKNKRPVLHQRTQKTPNFSNNQFQTNAVIQRNKTKQLIGNLKPFSSQFQSIKTNINKMERNNGNLNMKPNHLYNMYKSVKSNLVYKRS